ncbi:hypothetical protein HBN50_07265 [Halobacteriovorax sp. GB3]|uniref:hypothetical protein n=1 Tax=Halobacteriovorax sp. GB3 TaxID=2719615 RepID=UPI00235F0B07|nr:hypothetical protein [Halobacteriovorax sp. GB3]MDD0852888.1 hypothetical protein [Halobacteriovorax sp. GB3]
MTQKKSEGILDLAMMRILLCLLFIFSFSYDTVAKELFHDDHCQDVSEVNISASGDCHDNQAHEDHSTHCHTCGVSCLRHLSDNRMINHKLIDESKEQNNSFFYLNLYKNPYILSLSPPPMA